MLNRKLTPPLTRPQVKVKRRGDDQKFLAKVLAIGTECDIALLTVEVSIPLWQCFPDSSLDNPTYYCAGRSVDRFTVRYAMQWPRIVDRLCKDIAHDTEIRLDDC